MLKKIKKNSHGIILVFLLSIFLSMIVTDFITVPLHAAVFQCVDGDCVCACRTLPRSSYCDCERGGYRFFYYCYCYCEFTASSSCVLPK